METTLLLTIRAATFLVLIIPLIVNADPLPNTFFPFIVGKALYGRALIEALVGLWIILALRFPAYRPPRSWLLAIFGVYLGVGVLASVFGVSPQRSLWSTYERMQGIVDLAHWFAFTVVLASVFRSNVDWRALLNVNLGISLVVALLGLLQNFDVRVVPFLQARDRIDITLGNPTYVGAYMLVNFLVGLGFLVHSLQIGPREAPPNATRAKGGHRRKRRRAPVRQTDLSRPAWLLFAAFWVGVVAVAIWTPPTSWGTGGAILVLLAVVTATAMVAYLLWRAEEPSRPQLHAFGPPMVWWRLFWMIAIALSFWMLIWSGTRGAFIGLVAAAVGLAVVYLLIGRVRWLRAMAVSLLGIMAALALLVGVARNTPIIQRLGDVNPLISQIVHTGEADDNSPRSRLASMRAGLRGFVDRPILGWGPENYSIAYDRHVGAESFIGVADSYDQAHNKLLEELTTEGILGFLSYVAIWLYLVRVIIRRAREAPDREQIFILFIGAALLGYFVQNLFLFDTPATILQYILLLGFAVHLETTLEAEPQTVAQEEGMSGATGSTRDRMRELRPRAQALMWLTYASVLVLVGFGIFFVSVRPYIATKTILKTFQQTDVVNGRAVPITWERRLSWFEDTIDDFPPLANYPRVIMFNLLADNWSNIPANAAERALKLVETEADRALTAEPEEWRIPVALATLYQKIAVGDPANLERAGRYVDRAAGFAPQRPEVYESRVRQLIAEHDYEAAREQIDKYLALNSRAAYRFEGFLAQIKAAEDQQGVAPGTEAPAER